MPHYTNDNDTVYPLLAPYYERGLTKRELFAKDILCALITHDKQSNVYGLSSILRENLIAQSIEITDTFIFALNNYKPQEKG